MHRDDTLNARRARQHILHDYMIPNDKEYIIKNVLLSRDENIVYKNFMV